jgi:hypothetical protein
MRFTRLLVILLALACAPMFSHAAEVKMTSSTQYLWYQNFLVNKDQNEVAEYLRLNLIKLDKEGKVNLYSYGRVTKQLSSSDLPNNEVQDPRGSLYYAYLEYRDAVKNHLDLKAGRTNVNAAAVSGIMDGLYLNLKNLGPLGFTAFGGREVIFQDKKEIGGGNAITGGSVYLDMAKNTHVEVSYGKQYRDSEVARENVALDFSTTPLDSASIYGRVKYNSIAKEYNELLLGAKLAPFKDLILRAEYYQSLPTFDNTSIYTIFAVNKYKETSVAAEYRLTENYQINAKYAREDFGEDANANVYVIGLLAQPVKDLILNASYEKRNGFAGELSGVRLHGEYKIFKAAILAGIDYDDFKRDAARNGIAKKYWAGLNYGFNKIISAAARVENNVNFNYDNSYQGRVAINLNF